MNKHVNKLNKEASDARKMIDDSESGDSEDSDGGAGGDGNKGNGASKSKSAAVSSGEKPTEEQVEKLEEKLEAAQADQKNLFLIIFQVRSGRLAGPFSRVSIFERERGGGGVIAHCSLPLSLPLSLRSVCGSSEQCSFTAFLYGPLSCLSVGSRIVLFLLSRTSLVTS